MDELDKNLKRPLAFRPNTARMSPECITSIHTLGERGERSEWVSRACEFLYDYENHRQGFLIRIIQNNFEQCKHLLRKIGRSLKEFP